MEKVKVKVAWSNRNFSATFGENIPGAIAFTADTFEALKKEARETLEFHVEGMVEDGDDVPMWLEKGDYELEYEFMDFAAEIRSIEPYTSLAAISRETGINQQQLSHYASGVKTPREGQRRRIVEGIHTIATRLMAVR